MKVTCNYIAFWALLIMSMQTANKWLSGVLIFTAILSLIAHYFNQE